MLNQTSIITATGIFLVGLACAFVSRPDVGTHAARKASHVRERENHPELPASNAFSSPQACAEKALEDGNLQSLEQTLRMWHERDPAALERWLESNLRFPETAETLVTALARCGLSHAALEHSLALPETHRAICLQALFTVLAATAPLDAWTLADTLQSTDQQENARDVILESATAGALPQLADLALSHMRASGRSGVMQNVLSRWTLQDPAEASAWLNANAVPVDIRDEIASHLVFQCDAENRSPETALAWAESISKPASRYQAVAAAAREWSSSHPAQADAAIRNSPILTREEKQSLLSSLSAAPDEPDFPPAD